MSNKKQKTGNFCVMQRDRERDVYTVEKRGIVTNLMVKRLTKNGCKNDTGQQTTAIDRQTNISITKRQDLRHMKHTQNQKTSTYKKEEKEEKQKKRETKKHLFSKCMIFVPKS